MNGLKEFGYCVQRDTGTNYITVVTVSEKCLSQFFDELGRKLGINNFWKIVLKKLDSNFNALVQLDIKNRTDDPIDSCRDFAKYAESAMNHIKVFGVKTTNKSIQYSPGYNELQHRYTIPVSCILVHSQIKIELNIRFRIKDYAPNEADLIIDMEIEP